MSSIDIHLSALVESAVARALAAWTPPTMPIAPPSETGPRLLTVAQTAELLNISEASVRRLIDSGQLVPVRCFSALRVDVRDVENWVERSKGGSR